MDIIVSIIFGIVQGLTEFIPVSSSGHLLLLHELVPNGISIDDLSFDVALHVGTLAALFAFFWRDVATYAKALMTSISGFARAQNRPLENDEKLAWYLVFAMVPAGIAGLFLESFIDSVLRSPYIVVVMLIVVGVAFFIVEAWAKKQQPHTLQHMTLQSALTIGFAQILALVPGTSRSGITIITGMLTGLTRADAARFSFLMSMPLVAAAGLKKSLDLASMSLSSEQYAILFAGALSAAIVGYIAIAGLLKYLSHRSLAVFGVYRILLAIVMLLVLTLK